MIYIQMKPEPKEFDVDVRQPGMAFLKETPKPNKDQFKNHSYWCKALPAIRKRYNHICAYSAFFINPLHGAASIDHFIPKSIEPALAYEWSNFRYASLTFNRRKGTRTVLDPFKIDQNWFMMEFPSLLIMPNPELNEKIKDSVCHTIRIFKFNEDENYKDVCKKYLNLYCMNKISLDELKDEAPFIAQQLVLQKKTEEIKTIMDFSQDKEDTEEG